MVRLRPLQSWLGVGRQRKPNNACKQSIAPHALHSPLGGFFRDGQRVRSGRFVACRTQMGLHQGDMFIIHASIALQFFFSRQGDEVVCCHTQCKLLGQEVGEGVASSLRSVLVLRSGYNTCNCPLRSLQVRGGAGIQVWHTWHLCYDLDDGGWSCNNQTYQTKILMPPWSDV